MDIDKIDLLIALSLKSHISLYDCWFLTNKFLKNKSDYAMKMDKICKDIALNREAHMLLCIDSGECPHLIW